MQYSPWGVNRGCAGIKIPETFDKRMCKKGQEGSGPVDCGLELAPYQREHAVAPGIMTPQKWFVTDWSCLIDIKHVHESDVIIGRPNVSRKSSLPLRIFEGLCVYIIAFFSSS